MNQDGVLLINKPRGMTSHDVVMKLRRILDTKKVGHTGTLDPDVDGVLPICVGTATKLVQFLTAESKTYIGEVTLGISTTTEDASGEIIEQNYIEEPPTKNKIEEILKSMIGTSVQTPPMYSAVKVNGKKLYEYARAKQAVERPQRTVTIHQIGLLGEIIHHEGLVSFKFFIHGSKGIFIRTVAVTIGEKLSMPAHMSNLTRIASGSFKIEDCQTLEDVVENGPNYLSISQALIDFSTVTVDNWVENLVKNGVKLREEQISPPMKQGQFLIKNKLGNPLSIHVWDDKKKLYVAIRGLW